MKRYGLAVGLAVALATAASAAEGLRLAVVNLDQVFNAHPKTKASEAELKKAEAAIQDELEQMEAEGRALQDEVRKLREQARNPILSEEVRLKKSNEAEEKLTELQEFQLRMRRTQETKLKQLRDQLLKKRQGIVDELMVVVAEFAKEEGFDLVLDRSGLTANLIPITVYCRPELDVTDKLIARLTQQTD